MSKRSDPVTRGDLDDFADALKDGLKETFGSLIPAPKPKGDGDGGGDGGDGDGGGDGGGDDGEPKSKFGLSGRWWGAGE